jgi:hypothetical protein
LAHDVDPGDRLQPSDANEEAERSHRPTQGVFLPWTRPAATCTDPPRQPVLPKEPRGTGDGDSEGERSALMNYQEESSCKYTQPTIPGPAHCTGKRRSHSVVGEEEERTSPREFWPRKPTGLQETGEQAYPSPRPTQHHLESEAASAETRQVGEEEKQRKRRRGRPVTRRQAVIPGSVALRAIQPKEIARGQEQESVEQPLRPGAGGEDSSLGRGNPQHRATNAPPSALRVKAR